MTLQPIYLTFPNKEVAEKELFQGDDQRYAFEIANPVPMPITSFTGEFDKEGSPVSEVVEGYHVNAVCSSDLDLSPLEEWRVYPKTPSVKWFI